MRIGFRRGFSLHHAAVTDLTLGFYGYGLTKAPGGELSILRLYDLQHGANTRR